jgi:hypothetical protein
VIMDIFFGRRRQAKIDKKAPTYEVIQKIERFAPREYKSEREVYYYNYNMLGPYLKPLLALLDILSHKERLQHDRPDFACDLFLRLKDFYDPKDRLPMAVALRDPSLVRRFREIFLFFYNVKHLPEEEMAEWLKGISC